MNPTGDYTVHFADPDMHVSYHLVNVQTDVFTSIHSCFEWQVIMQVIIPRPSALAHAAVPAQMKDLRRALSVSRPQLPQE